MKIPEGSRRRQSSKPNRDNGLIEIMPCRDPKHGITSGTCCHFGSASSSDQCTISCPPMQTWYDEERKKIPLDHYAMADRPRSKTVLSSCKVALSQGRYTWRHNRVLQKLAEAISMAKGQSSHIHHRGRC